MQITGEKVSVGEMGRAREERVIRQQEMLAAGGSALICFSLNIPGAIKVFPLAESAFSIGNELLVKACEAAEIRILKQQIIRAKTGIEGYYLVAAEACTVKQLTVALEDQHPLGRIWDIDVLGGGGVKISRTQLGQPMRTCIICGAQAFLCARAGKHRVEEILEVQCARIQGYLDRRN